MSQCGKPYSSKDKWVVACISGLMFFLIASPVSFQISNTIFSKFGIKTWIQSPTIIGLSLHAFIFCIITRIMMK